jgi:hypothetical protein
MQCRFDSMRRWNSFAGGRGNRILRWSLAKLPDPVVFRTWRMASGPDERSEIWGTLQVVHRARVARRFDIFGATVEILAIVAKSEAGQWLAQFANPA